LVFRPAFALINYRVTNGATVTINEHNACYDVTNNSANGADVLVPTRTVGEWTAFRNNLPAGVTAVVNGSCGYNPASEGNLRLWLDASDASTLFQTQTCVNPATADTTAIGCWQDKSGNAFSMIQATAGNRPTLNTAQMNGRNVVLFNNTAAPLAAPFTASANGLVIYVVGNYNNASGADRAWLEIHTAGGNRHFFIYQRYSSNTNYTPTAGVDSIFAVSHPSGTAFNAYHDSTLLQAGTSAFGQANGTYGNLTLGDDASGGNQLRAKVGEILVFQGTQTQTVRERIEGYLACKWGTQGRLPGAHPYKATCP
jgi:hypothetical protein